MLDFSQVNEIHFMGHVFPRWTDGLCPVAVTVSPLSAAASNGTEVTRTAPTMLNYTLAATPVVTSVSPSFGSSLGGTTLTIAGMRARSCHATAHEGIAGVVVR